MQLCYNVKHDEALSPVQGDRKSSLPTHVRSAHVPTPLRPYSEKERFAFALLEKVSD